MILAFALIGSFAATLAAAVALLTGQSWWIGLASYMGAGLLTVCIAATLTAVTLNSGTRKTEVARLRTGIGLAEH
jgi:hypothetical protein